MYAFVTVITTIVMKPVNTQMPTSQQFGAAFLPEPSPSNLFGDALSRLGSVRGLSSRPASLSFTHVTSTSSAVPLVPLPISPSGWGQTLHSWRISRALPHQNKGFTCHVLRVLSIPQPPKERTVAHIPPQALEATTPATRRVQSVWKRIWNWTSPCTDRQDEEKTIQCRLLTKH